MKKMNINGTLYTAAGLKRLENIYSALCVACVIALAVGDIDTAPGVFLCLWVSWAQCKGYVAYGQRLRRAEAEE